MNMVDKATSNDFERNIEDEKIEQTLPLFSTVLLSISTNKQRILPDVERY